MIHSESSIVDELRRICAQSSGARAFFTFASQKVNDSTETSIEILMRRSGMERQQCIELAKELSAIGCGRYLIGRRGNPTRICWNYSLKDIGLAALGLRDALFTSRSSDFNLEVAERTNEDRDAAAAGDGFQKSISEAKRLLAINLGVPIENIEITIRG